MFKFPYTNLHELNLDWILEKVKHFAELIPPMETAVEDFQSLQGDVEQAVEDANQALEDAGQALETAEEAKEIAEQAAQGTIADGAVTTAKLDDGAVTTAKIDDGAVTGAKIASGTIQAGNLSSGCVTTTQILDGTISPDDLGTECVTNSKLGAGAVTTTKIDDGAVTTAKLDTGSVTNGKIADNAVTPVKINAPSSVLSSSDHVGSNSSLATLRWTSDVVSKTLRLYAIARGNSTIPADDEIFTLPEEARPVNDQYIPAIIVTSSNVTTAGSAHIAPSGVVSQSVTNSCALIIIVGEYTLL